MNKWLIGIISSFACLLMLSAALVVMLSIMYAVSFSPVHLWKLPLALPLGAAGFLLLKWLDRK